jgi:hypothetical protein
MSGQNNWMANGAGGLYGNVNGGGNSGSLTISARDSLDFMRLGSPGRTPEAEYPDGYLGSPNSRRGDKLLEKIGSLNQRSYTRGVHRGERIPASDYQWTSDWNPQRGIKTQMTGMRQALAADGPEPRLPNNTNSLPPQGPVGNIRIPQMQRLLPSWN